MKREWRKGWGDDSIPVPNNFPFLVAFLPLGRPTLGLVATLRGSSFSLSRLGGIGHSLLLFRFSFLYRCVSWFARAITLAFLRYSATSSFIKFLRMGSSSKCLVDDVDSSSEWILCTFLCTFSKRMMSSTMKTAALHLASSSLNCFCRRSSWDPAVWWGGIGIDVYGTYSSSSARGKSKCSSCSCSMSLSSVMNGLSVREWGRSSHLHLKFWMMLKMCLQGILLCVK